MLVRQRQLLAAAAALALGTAACGDDPVRGGDIVADVDTTEADTGGDATDEDTQTTVELPNACTDDSDCGADSCRSGVCVEDPPTASNATITDPSTNVGTDQLPDLSCVDATTADEPAGPATATVFGAVARFGSGRKTVGMRVDIIRADTFDPTACEAETTDDDKKDCYRGHGDVVGSTVSVAAPTIADTPCAEHVDCPLGYECLDPADLGEGQCEEQFGLYEIPDVPTNTPLIIRSYATESEFRWHDTYVFNAIVFADQVGDDGRAQFDATMVSDGQWILTTNTVQLSDIPKSNGAVGGRVRDCRSADRDSWPISEVLLDLANPAKAVVYFNDLEDDTVPLIDRETSNILGRYAALDIPAGWNTISGSARVGGEVVSIGSVPVYVIPNSLSIVGWPGRQPYWRQN